MFHSKERKPNEVVKTNLKLHKFETPVSDREIVGILSLSLSLSLYLSLSLVDTIDECIKCTAQDEPNSAAQTWLKWSIGQRTEVLGFTVVDLSQSFWKPQALFHYPFCSVWQKFWGRIRHH